jgi:dihydrofolate synthase/folylpolyglutamate synthase
VTIRQRLFGLEQFGVKLGLDSIRILLDALGHPQRSYPTLHIAGTNGKGSVAAMVERGLRAAGYRTGRYTSPHLADIEERFSIDGRALSPGTFDAVAADVLRVMESALATGDLSATPTFFEVTTAIGFEAFRRERVDVGVIEVGLGGRFDATNVIEPRVAAITSIDFDHERHLGSTLAAIAFEKAGIAKRGIPLIVGAVHGEAAMVIKAVAADHGAPVIDASADSTLAVRMVDGVATVTIQTPRRTYLEVRLSLAGRHQAGNALVAARMLEALDDRDREPRIVVPKEAVIAGLAQAEWPARLEWLHLPGGGDLLIDAAHNPSGAQALASYLEDAAFAPLPLVVATMQDKNVDAMIAALAPAASLWIATEAQHRRSRTARQMADDIARLTRTPVRWHADPQEAVRDALAQHRRAAAAGSIYMVGPLRAALLSRGAMLSSETHDPDGG